jgi:dienelactone hydrolase
MIVETPILVPNSNATLSGVIVRDVPAQGARQIGVMVTGSWLTVKEQMALFYARRLAARGYAAFVFDFSGFGESGGQPRQAEIPIRKIADLSLVAEFLSTLSFVEATSIGHVAVCASAQYAQHARRIAGITPARARAHGNQELARIAGDRAAASRN